jgi:hypothetical protein
MSSLSALPSNGGGLRDSDMIVLVAEAPWSYQGLMKWEDSGCFAAW